MCVISRTGRVTRVIHTFLGHLPEFKSYCEGLGNCQSYSLSLENRRKIHSWKREGFHYSGCLLLISNYFKHFCQQCSKSRNAVIKCILLTLSDFWFFSHNWSIVCKKCNTTAEWECTWESSAHSICELLVNLLCKSMKISKTFEPASSLTCKRTQQDVY